MSAPGVAVHTPLFTRLIGAAFTTLPNTVQHLHRCPGRSLYHGDVSVERGADWLSRGCAWATRLPPAGHRPIEVEIVAASAMERWTRHVGRHAMHSRLWAGDGLLCERLGLVTFGFRLGVEHGSLTWRVVRVRALGLPLPASMFSRVLAREGETDGRYTFDVRAELPVIGLLVHYRGWLHVES